MIVGLWASAVFVFFLSAAYFLFLVFHACTYYASGWLAFGSVVCSAGCLLVGSYLLAGLIRYCCDFSREVS